MWLATVIIAEIGLSMSAFPTPAHLVSWIGMCQSASQSGARHGKDKQKKGNSYARAAAGQAAAAAVAAVGAATFLGERYARIARRRDKAIAWGVSAVQGRPLRNFCSFAASLPPAQARNLLGRARIAMSDPSVASSRRQKATWDRLPTCPGRTSSPRPRRPR